MQGIIEQIGLFLETVGVLIILIAQAKFIVRSHKKWGDYKKEFIDVSQPRIGYGNERIKEMSNAERDKAMKLFPLAGLLYEDFIYTIGGLGITLIGLAIQFWSFFL